MNANIPHAIAMIVQTIGVDKDKASAAVFALQKAGLITDPQRSFGTVLHKRTTGAWSPEPRTELETHALAWDAACGRAARLAERIRTECAEGCGLMGVQVNGDRLLLKVQVTAAAQWGEWRRYLGITKEDPRPNQDSYLYYGEGHRDGVAVAVLAYDAPAVEKRVEAAAAMPHRHDGVIYDLALPHKDARDQVWEYEGLDAGGRALLAPLGATGGVSSPLADVVQHRGPLTPVREPVQAAGAGQPLPAEAPEQPKALASLDILADAAGEFMEYMAKQDPEQLERDRAEARGKSPAAPAPAAAAGAESEVPA